MDVQQRDRATAETTPALQAYNAVKQSEPRPEPLPAWAIILIVILVMVVLPLTIVGFLYAFREKLPFNVFKT